MQLRTEIEIAAPPSKVWQVLTDFEAYHEWNPFIPSIAGKLEPGAELRVIVQPPESSGRTFSPKVIRCEPEQELRWAGTLVGAWLLRGEHYFTLTETSTGSTRFAHGENFSGFAVRFLYRQFTHLTRGFVYMNRALKRRVEEQGG